MKKTISILLCILLTVLAFSSCNNRKNQDKDEKQTEVSETECVETLQESPADDFYVSNLDDGTVSVAYKGKSENVIIPKQIDGKTVSAISLDGFTYSRAFLKNVVLPDTITMIGNNAFKDCALLESINFPKSLTKIGSSAFMNCTSLKQVEIYSDCLSDLSSNAFGYSGIETLVLSEGVTQIPDGCFGATKISKVELPSTVKTIGWQAFGACEALETVVLNDGLVSIGLKAFVNNVKLKQIVIPKTVTAVDEMVFSGCESLERVEFLGNAPSTYEHPEAALYPDLFKPVNADYTVYYHQNASGFTSPEWYGYPTQILP